MPGLGPRNFLQPCLLLLLRERPDYGYDLAERLCGLGLDDSDPARVYRSLHAMQRYGLIHSGWSPSTNGPSRRMYRLTPRGVAALDEWTHELREVRHQLDAYLNRYEGLGRSRIPRHAQIGAEEG